jgi:hypothetical protein
MALAPEGITISRRLMKNSRGAHAQLNGTQMAGLVPEWSIYSSYADAMNCTPTSENL